MRDNLRGAVWRLAIFVAVCAFGIFSMFAVFSQLRFEREDTYRAQFTSVSGLKTGDFVRIAGVEVGKVKHISLLQDTTAVVEFSTDASVVLTRGSKAIIRYADLIGGRYLALDEGAGDPKKLAAGDTVALDHTAPALDLDALIGGFRPLFRALEPDQVNALTGQLIQAFQGQGAAIGSILSQTASVTETLADRNQLIGEVISNLATVLNSLDAQSKQVDRAVTSLSDLVQRLADRKQDITASLGYADAAAGSIADLLSQARPPIQKVVHETDRIAGTILADRDYFDNLLNTLPDAYKMLTRQGLYGDFFSFYLCDVALKLNGKGGQPVYVKLVGQDSGRCAPQ